MDTWYPRKFCSMLLSPLSIVYFWSVHN